MPGEDTPLQGVRRLLPRRIAIWENERLEITQYFELREALDAKLSDRGEAARLIGDLCKAAVVKRLHGKENIGLFLSGGLDSSAVALWLKEAGANVTAFSLDFGEKSVEKDRARAVAGALQIPLHFVKVGGEDLLPILPDLAWRLDMPFGDAVIYKENRNDWQRAEIVVTTVQSLLFNNKYQRVFSPTDFDLVISDEAHRSIGGNARAVFDYFVGYKLGLTATPRDYLKRFDKKKPSTRDPREAERRLLLDTYRTFGCENSMPTFRYSLLDGVKEGYLINPTVVDARTEITTELLSEEGFVVNYTDDNGDDQEDAYKQSEFEKRFFSEATNLLFCKTFLENALRDPVSGEIGKSIVFAVSQHHAAKLAQILNEMADRMFPGKYQSDFAVQVTSQVTGAQQMTINFTNNNLLGSANFNPAYKTSKARVCVTVGMMTTGYDCPDILNLGLFRPIFSPTDFIQIKGRGTRKHDFRERLFDESLKADIAHPHKTAFKLFDFFAKETQI